MGALDSRQSSWGKDGIGVWPQLVYGSKRTLGDGPWGSAHTPLVDAQHDRFDVLGLMSIALAGSIISMQRGKLRLVLFPHRVCVPQASPPSPPHLIAHTAFQTPNCSQNAVGYLANVALPSTESVLWPFNLFMEGNRSPVSTLRQAQSRQFSHRSACHPIRPDNTCAPNGNVGTPLVLMTRVEERLWREASGERADCTLAQRAVGCLAEHLYGPYGWMAGTSPPAGLLLGRLSVDYVHALPGAGSLRKSSMDSIIAFCPLVPICKCRRLQSTTVYI
ncbi:uncharacterized protein LACBIDRAFT_325743 [Laccaria bicolor S238N-H82]|uniref:Predicted protein n=1 Tax=Laccaria bicolor (strain S238N-H82 / ATCC MYA-4686) TaxID=486041 RepID=B0D631_LACBS|nr:uncharacterized protein LACBIDRAFT_325743 [Laccaria bicolor S238N-H82]EDR10130.1 predicted protein [Laccaria bicolor S238N-H82]|eukprot:XP_001879515.1 predicted protein [Laccaria bicolor S238N-H82]